MQPSSTHSPFLAHQQTLAIARQRRAIQQIKWGIWLYFFLLIFEGALRKWVLPGLAAPLLIIRDPVALYLIVFASSRNVIRFNPYLVSVLLITVLSIFTAILMGHGNWSVALFGARIFLLHFPLIFIIGRVFDADDVIRVGTIMLWLALPMTVLITLQFYSPQSALVNLGVGADQAGGGFSGALGYYRPPATFSFTNGTTLFYGLLGCFVFYGWLVPNTVKRWLLISATVCLIAAIPLSISRSLFFHVVITAGFTLLAITRKPAYVGQVILAVLFGSLLLIGLSQTSLFQTSITVFTDRFTTANTLEGGLEGVFLDRFLGGMITAITESADLPFFGYGLGLGTNVGAQLLSGDRTFLVAEEEWGRIIGELGLLLGLAIILIRVALTANLAIVSYQRLRRGYFLPWLLLSMTLIILPQGSWAQPTALGFSIFVSGLLIAALRQQTKG